MFCILVFSWFSPAALAERGARHLAVQVDVVLDGDTLVLTDRRHVRLVGINAPEQGHACREDDQGCIPTPDEPLAQEARRLLQSQVAKKTLSLITGEETHDRYGRLLAYLRLADGSDPAEALLNAGLASVIAIPPNLDRLARYQALESQARRQRRGLWGHGYFAALDAGALSSDLSGYHFVRGRVDSVGRSRKYLYLDLGPKLAIMVAHTDWERYFGFTPESLLHREVEVRGWIVRYKDRLQLRIHHPAMLEIKRMM